MPDAEVVVPELGIIFRFRTAQGEEILELSPENSRRLFEIIQGLESSSSETLRSAYAFARCVGRRIEVFCTFEVPR